MAHLYSQNQDQVVIDLPGHATDRPRDSVDSNLTISSLSENSDAAFELSSDDLPRTLAEQEAEGLLAHQSTQRQQRPEESSSWRHLSWKQRLVPCIFLLLVAFLVGFRPPWFDMRFGFSKDKVSTANSSSTGGMRNIAYYVNWAIYGRKYRPQDLPVEDLTHVLYAFANVRPETGEVYLSDAWADEQIHWEGDDWNEPGSNLYGCFKQLYFLKKRNPALKVLLSIGGWTYSSNFGPAAGTPHGRAAFARSATQLVETYGLDGLDVDWEYPTNDREASDYVELLKETRKALDQLAQSKNETHPYELSVAAPGAPSKIDVLRIKEMDKYLSFWNLMLYDFAGSWDSMAGHAANLHPVSSSAFSGEKAIDRYRKHGVAKDKIVVGMPLYGRAFMNTDGPGAPYSGVGDGSWEQGVWDFKALPKPGSHINEDKKAGASWSYNPSTREMISYDTPGMGTYKAQWIVDKKLGGAMFWESSADFPKDHPDRMIGRVAQTLFAKSKDQTPNHLSFPGSKFDNLRAGM